MRVQVNVAYEDNLPVDVIDEGGEQKLLDLLNRRAVTKLHADAKLVRVARPVAKSDPKSVEPVTEQSAAPAKEPAAPQKKGK